MILCIPDQIDYLCFMTKRAKAYLYWSVVGLILLFLAYKGIWHITHNACGIDMFLGLFLLGVAVIILLVGWFIWRKIR